MLFHYHFDHYEIEFSQSQTLRKSINGLTLLLFTFTSPKSFRVVTSLEKGEKKIFKMTKATFLIFLIAMVSLTQTAIIKSPFDVEVGNSQWENETIYLFLRFYVKSLFFNIR